MWIFVMLSGSDVTVFIIQEALLLLISETMLEVLMVAVVAAAETPPPPPPPLLARFDMVFPFDFPHTAQCRREPRRTAP